MLDQIKDLFRHRREVLQVALDRSPQAQALLDNPLLQTFFIESAEQLQKMWAATAPEDVVSREQAYLLLQAVNKLRRWLKAYVEDETANRQELEKIVHEG